MRFQKKQSLFPMSAFSNCTLVFGVMDSSSLCGPILDSFHSNDTLTSFSQQLLKVFLLLF